MEQKVSKRILILTGEVSGDMHGGYLLKHLKQISPNIKAFALGSNHLKEAGAVIVKDITQKSTIGFLETITNIPSLFLLKNKIVTMLKQQHIDMLICIDFQGFNLLVAKKAKEMNIPVVYYIPPQEWIWGSEKGAEKITKITEKIITIFKQEYEAYKKHTKNVKYFGHPLTQIIKNFNHSDNIEKNIISVFPGSRKQEIKHCFPEIIKIIKEIHTSNHEQKFIINLSNNHFLKKIQNQIKGMENYVQISIGKTYEILAKSKYAIVTSGTITLECLLMGVPHTVLYKFNPISYFIIKRVLKNKFKYNNYSLTNILAEKELVPEYLQCFDTTKIANQIINIASSDEKTIILQNEFNAIKQSLSSKNGTNILLEISKYILS